MKPLLAENMQIIDGFDKRILHLIGLEPITFGTEIRRSIQLSYKRYLSGGTLNKIF